MLDVLSFLLVFIVGIYAGAYLSFKGMSKAIEKLQIVHRKELKELFNTLKGNNYGEGKDKHEG